MLDFDVRNVITILIHAKEPTHIKIMIIQIFSSQKTKSSLVKKLQYIIILKHRKLSFNFYRFLTNIL